MNLGDISLNFVINLVAGILGIAFVLWIERQRRPDLYMSIGKPASIPPDDRLGRQEATWPHILIHNKKIPRWIGWVCDREPALNCRAWITFHHLDGHRVFDREMSVRWVETEEPFVQLIEGDKGKAAKLINVQNSVDIPPREATAINVAIRIKGEDECYGWNNESYLHNWRHPKWRLEKGRYFVKVRAKTSGREYVDAFLLVSDVPYEDFRIDEIDAQLKSSLK